MTPLKIYSFLLAFYLLNATAYAACTGTAATWGGSNLNWNTAANWSPAVIPNAATFDVTINSGNPVENLTTNVGCVTINGGTLVGSTARTLTLKGDSFTSTPLNGLATVTNLTIVIGPHTVPATPQTFTFNQTTSSLRNVTVASTSVPGAGLYGVTLTNSNAGGTATIATLANTGLNSTKTVGNITATTYTNTAANSTDVTAGTFKINNYAAGNTVSGGSLNVKSGGTFATTTTFAPRAGFTTTVDNGSTLTVTTTSAPAGTLNVNGVMTTTQFNPTATSTTTIGATGTITSSGTSTPLGILNVSGTLNSTTFAPTGTVNILAGGDVLPTTSSIPTGTAMTLNISGTLSTPIFSPTASGVGSSVTINNGGVLEATTVSSPATNITIATGGTFNSSATGRTYSPTAGTTNISGVMNVATFNPGAGTVNVNNGSPLGLLNVTTTATHSGALNVNGTMTTPIFNPKTASTTTIGLTGDLTCATSSAPVGTATVSITGTMTTPTYTPASTSVTSVNNGGLLNVTTSANPSGNITVASGGTFTVPTYSPTSTSTTNVSGVMNVTNFTPGASARINVLNGGVLNVTNFTPNATSIISVAAGGTLNITTLNGALAATVTIAGTVNITNLPTISSGLLSVSSGGKLNFINGVTLASSGFTIASGGTLQVGDNQTVTVNAGVTLTTPIYAPTGTSVTTLINATGTLFATTSCTPSATSIYSISGTLRSPLFSSIAGASVTVNSGGLLNTTTSASPASDILIAAGGTFTNAGAYSPASPSTTTILGTMTTASISSAAGSTITVVGAGSPVLTVSGTTANSGTLNVNGAMTTNIFNPAAGSITNIASTETLTVTTTSAPAGTVNVSGTITTTQYNPTAVSTTTIASTGVITSSGACTPLGILDVSGSLTCTTFAPTKTVTIQTGGVITASTSSIPTGLAFTLSVSGTLTTPTFSPTASGAGSSITINSGGKIEATTTSSPATNITIASGGVFNSTATGRTFSPTAGTTNIYGTMNVATFNTGASTVVNVKDGTPKGLLTVTTTATPGGTFTVDGTMTTPIFNPKTGTITTISSTGTLTCATSSAPVGTASTSIAGTLTTPAYNPASTSTTTVNSGGLLSVTTSSVPAGNMTVATGGTLNVGTAYSPSSTSTTNNSGAMTVTTLSPGAGATFNTKSGGTTTVTTLTPNATSNNAVEAGGVLNVTTMTGALAATLNIFGTATVTNLPIMTSGTLDVKSGGRLIFSNGITLNNAAATLKIQGGGTLQLADTKTVTLTNGSFQILGTEDAFPQNISTKGTVEALSGGTFNFTTTGGTLSLTGFHFDRIGVNGLNIGGTTIVSNLRGGQFSHLSTNYASVKAIQINTSGTLPAAATTIAWNWGAFNDFTGTTPVSTAGYKLVSSSGCAGRSIDFTGWTGDWYETQPNFDITTVYTPGGCGITLSGSVTAVDVLFFNAVPFNKAIDLRWQTNAERNHAGFNVYRTDMYSVQLQQINKTLIRNTKNSGSNQASYRFIDQDVNNGQRYYYYIEDVEVSGKKVLHGPVSAIALAELGNPPADNANENSGTLPNDPTNDDNSSDPSYEDLGNGIKILSRSNKTLRLEITPGTPLFSVSAWNNAFEDVNIPGYSKMTSVGSPELPEKEIMIDVQNNYTTAEIIDSSIIEMTMAGHLISPAPNYVLNGNNILIPSFSPNPAVYNQANDFTEIYYSLQTNIVSVNKTKFLKIKINPLKLNPVTRVVSMAKKIVLDIALDGDDWEVTPPDVNSGLNTYSIGNTLRIDYDKSGVYQMSYEDFVNSGVEDPFIASATSLWRLYNEASELPLEIHSKTGVFSPGDYIRFFAPFTKELESRTNQLILSPVNLTEENSNPKRLKLVDVNPAGQTESSEVLTEFTKVFEKNLKFIDGVTLNDSLDHFFYADLVNYPGMDTLTITAALPEIDFSNNKNVQVKVHVRGRLNMAGIPVKHNLILSLNGTEEGESAFTENDRQVLIFEVPADHFLEASNNFVLKVDGKFARSDENDFVLIDKVELVYRGYKSGNSGINNFSIEDVNQVHKLGHFLTDQIDGYDLTFPLDPKKLSNIDIATVDGGATFETKFLVDDDSSDEGVKRYSFLEANSFLKPSALSLNPGQSDSLKDSSNRADLIVYGSPYLISALQDLIDKRLAEGLEVKTVTPNQVYSEFSFGRQSSRALKDFMNTALTNWVKPPKFLLILGDGTSDPLDFNVNKLLPSQRSALEKSTLPAPLIAGRFVDFSSDNYFVTPPESHLPKLSVGRLPTNDPNKIRAYVSKVQSYEDGETAPTELVKNITFFADQDTGNYEQFGKHTQNMILASSSFTTTLYDRVKLGSKDRTKDKINEEFNIGPLMISMMGHGAFDRFGDNIYNINDARSLTNKNLPIVTVWNCESAYYYDANSTYKSLAEELIFNPNGGAIIYMGSTTQTTPQAQSKLAVNFFDQLSAINNKPWNGIRLGELLFQAKLQTGDDIYEKDIVNSFSIIGDPSLKLPAHFFSAEESRPQEVQSQAAAASSQKKSGFGCTANADDGSSSSPWYTGLLEWLAYMALIVFGIKRLLRMRIANL